MGGFSGERLTPSPQQRLLDLVASGKQQQGTAPPPAPAMPAPPPPAAQLAPRQDRGEQELADRRRRDDAARRSGRGAQILAGETTGTPMTASKSLLGQ